jgi:hypothetical protein
MHLRFDIQELGQTGVLFGSSDEVFWLHIARDDDTYRWGHHAAVRDPQQLGLTVRPDQLIEALGLNALPAGATEVALAGMVQRIEPDWQQLLFVQHDQDGRPLLRKEYWLERREPRLIRRIIFRDTLGRTHMDARLSDYRRISAGGPTLTHRVRVEWPLEGGVLELRVSRWRLEPQLTKDAPAFVAPHQRGKTFKHVILVDPPAPQE